MGSLIPRGAHWIKAAVAAFEPERNALVLDGCRVVRYRQLIVCPGIKLDWHGIEGLAETLGRNGVTSNYQYQLAPYTWELVQSLRGGKALFTQPAMPIKCAGAPQKAMYLSADYWRRNGVLDRIDIGFYNPGAVLFGVADDVPALMAYVKAYRIGLNFGHMLTAIDGPRRVATFSCTTPDGSRKLVQEPFDMIHVVPPKTAPDFIRVSPLADAAGWVDVDPATMRPGPGPTSMRWATPATRRTRRLRTQCRHRKIRLDRAVRAGAGHVGRCRRAAVGMLGVGGGFVMVPALRSYTDLPMDAVVATSLAVIALVSATGVASSAVAGNLDLIAAAPFCLGGLAGMLAGRMFAARVAGAQLQKAFAVLAAMVAAGMLWKVADAMLAGK